MAGTAVPLTCEGIEAVDNSGSAATRAIACRSCGASTLRIGDLTFGFRCVRYSCHPVRRGA